MMTKKDKDLLLKDLCARLPYGVKAILSEYHIDEFPYNGTYCDKVINLGIYESTINLLNHIEKYGIKPYLRPMSSMTEEEKSELKEYLDAEEVDCNGFGYTEGGTLEDYVSSIPYSLCNYVIDFLNAHHFDYRGLIEKGLALEAPEGMYKAEELK